MNQLLDDVALRIRHNAAMDTVEAAPEESDRYELFWHVLFPSRTLLELTVEEARRELRRRVAHKELVAA